MATASPRFALRPYLPADAPMLAQIFRESIEQLAEDDYSPAQIDAWSGAADEEGFAERLGKQLTLIATLNGSPVGFISLQGTNTVDMLYVHPAVVRQGVASMLLDAIERLAGARGAKELTTDASDSAADFFRRRGFTAEQRNTMPVGNEWIGNTTMKKKLVP